jgi:hypothetical protein
MEKITKTYRLFFICLLLIAFGGSIYFFYFRNEVESALLGNPSRLLSWLIQTLYPRLLIEQNRFEPSFFLQKADLIFYRASAVLLLISYFIGYFKNPVPNEKLRAFLLTSSNKRTFHFILISSILLYILIWQELYWHILDRLPIASFYKKNWFALSSQYPSEVVIHCLGISWLLAILSMISQKTRLAGSIFSAILFTWMQGYYFGFEKIDHSFYTFFWIALCLPFYFKENQTSYIESSWSLRWMQILIALTYTLSALEKLTISGWSWFSAENLQAHLLIHQIPAGIWLAQFPFLCSLLLIGSLLIQLGFLFILFFRKYTWWVLTGGIIFHMSTYFLMNIGHWINPWILVYVVFVYLNEKRK